MNRIATRVDSLSADVPQIGLPESFHVSTLKRRREHRVTAPASPPFATLAPLHYERGYAYPLLVWLHRRSGSEHQLRRIMPHVSLRNFVAAAPRGTVARRRGGFHWRQDAEGIEEAETRIFDCIAAAAEKFNIHPERIFLAGCGSGGTMAVRVAWNHPERFAGVATLGGELPSELCPLRRVNAMRRIPCLVAMSRHSPHYPEHQVCRDLRLMHSAGCTVALRQYPGADDLTAGMLSDLNCWLMELVCGRAGEV
jgi:phospholipase/carboxylesterase